MEGVSLGNQALLARRRHCSQSLVGSPLGHSIAEESALAEGTQQPQEAVGGGCCSADAAHLCPTQGAVPRPDGVAVRQT